ncbi:hypothetical protein ACB092_03G090300 [Castanea dentata]
MEILGALSTTFFLLFSFGLLGCTSIFGGKILSPATLGQKSSPLVGWMRCEYVLRICMRQWHLTGQW